MGGNSAYALPLALLALLAGLSAWLDHTVRAPYAPGAKTKTDPETIVENFRALETAPDGRARYRLEAATMRHFSHDQPTEFVTPVFSQFAADGVTGRARADTATLSGDGRTLTLSGNAALEETRADGQPGMRLRTGVLSIRPETQSFTAPGEITLENGGLRARANRMEWRGQTRVAELTGRVRAEYRHADH